MSFRPMVFAQGEWVGNGLRFATAEEALLNVTDLQARWTLVDNVRVDESDDPPNYRWDNLAHKSVPLNLES